MYVDCFHDGGHQRCPRCLSRSWSQVLADIAMLAFCFLKHLLWFECCVFVKRLGQIASSNSARSVLQLATVKPPLSCLINAKSFVIVLGSSNQPLWLTCRACQTRRNPPLAHARCSHGLCTYAMLPATLVSDCETCRLGSTVVLQSQ